MGTGASIKPHYFKKGHEESGIAYALCLNGSRSFIDDLAGNHKDAYRLSRILKTLKRIYEHGCDYAFESDTFKHIKGKDIDIDVVEARVAGSVIRVAAYIHEDWIPIYETVVYELFVFTKMSSF